MSRVVICGAVPFDAFIGRGRCPVTGEWSRWAIPPSVPDCSRVAAVSGCRAWLWEEIKAWALAEQARRLEARLAEMNAERRRRVSRGAGDVR